MPFLDPATSHLNMKVVLYGPDVAENARRLRAAHQRAGADVVLRKVHGDGTHFPLGATVLFFDAALGTSLFGHPLRLHLYALEGEPRAEHLAIVLAGVDGVVFVPGDVETTAVANLDNLRAYLRQANHALPTVLVQAQAGEAEAATIDRVVESVIAVFREHLVEG